MTTTTTSIEQFCWRFLHNDRDYKHLYDILDGYSDTFLQIDLCEMIAEKETFKTRFRTICFVVLRDKCSHAAYVLSILGFALHVHRQCQSLEWYNVETLSILLIEILTCINFDTTLFVKYDSCVIL